MANLDTATPSRRRGKVVISTTGPFKVDLDLHLVYEPPMDENDVGIVITRQFDLPFVPVEGLSVYSRDWEDCPEPQGMALKDVTWDVDREVFLATAYHYSMDFPIASIPLEVRCWLDKDWQWGSYMDRYQGDDTSKPPRRRQVGKIDDSLEKLDSKLEETLPLLPPDERPQAFNDLFRALIRHMVTTYSSLETAYAMDKTKRFLGPCREQSPDANARKDWEDAKSEYKRLSGDERWKWMNRVKKYPNLTNVVLGR